MKLWFETHSTSLDNEIGFASGHSDVSLSQTGLRQAAELGYRYGDRTVGQVYTSDLKRAVSTAAIAFSNRAIPIVADARLRECDYGEWTGCSVEKMHERRIDFVDRPFPGGESFRDVVRRVEQFLTHLTPGEAPVLVIAHRAPWYAFENLLKKRNLAEVVSSPWQWQPGWEYDL
jgi:2,3-bisphosphoglycerate-dependent phosphoglycerate mutase